MLKKVIFIFIAVLILTDLSVTAQSANDPVLMTIGGSPVSKSEFERVYRKNNNREDLSDPAAVQEYMQLFINYKLKVKEAETLRLDTGSAFVSELNGYKKQLAQPYLTDKDVSEELIKEAYERMKKEVRASHVLIKVAADALPKDTLEAWSRIMIIRDHLTGKAITAQRLAEYEAIAKKAFKGDTSLLSRVEALKQAIRIKGSNAETSFTSIAKSISEDPSAADNGGDLGYFTALMMVYPFETAAYNTKPGEISQPVRTKFGYHLIRVSDVRPASGEIHTAHIMVKLAPNSHDSVVNQAKQKIDEIYSKLKAGEKFEDLAQQYSDDRGSAKSGGVLPWFGTGRMVAEFEKAAFALANDGDVSQPIKTSYGWHIIKRLEKRPLASFDEKKAELKNQIQRDSRSEMSKSSMIARIKKENAFKEFTKNKDEIINALDTNLVNGEWNAASVSRLNKPLFSLGGKIYTQTDFANYIVSRQTKRSNTNAQAIGYSMYDNYVNESCIEFEESQLENKYSDFRNLMREYRDGILLFDLTDKMVWSKAVKDSAGLADFYENNKQNYMWGKRCKAIVYICSSKDIAGRVKKMLKKGESADKIAAEINDKSQLNVSIKEGTFSKGENEWVDQVTWVKGIAPEIVKGSQVVIVDIKSVLEPMPKSLDEAKGLVTSDYQNNLEQQWLIELRSKYEVKINDEVLKTIGK
ncbi:MAG: peptidylprolyl isomerase [Bacteroidia bacterium]|nr:peptidylprolyl isomerase [Bacteroidia bacterium]